MNHGFPYLRFDVYECSGDEEFLFGSIYASTIRCRRLVVVGRLFVNGLLVADRLVLIGGGRIGVLTCNEAIIITYSKPLIIGGIYCSKVYLDGSVKPVVVDTCRVGEICARNTLFNELYSRRVIFNEKCGVKRFGGCRTVVFNDPHVWFEEWSDGVDEIIYNYNVSC
ncbi:MAG: hypothetical protein B6U89_04685 [Desulfurococcales archaeon ex4484_58]|nr:MAG: hypothetical protein B6U89_04685 [Desulfurococcales archaeon ex4484_58]